MTVDFHVHSTASDGTMKPAALAEAGAAFAAMALTDHDCTDGVGEYLGARVEGACRRIAGIELSIDPGKGFDRFHLLGLGIDPGDAGVAAFLEKVLAERNARNSRIIANFRRIGIEMENPLEGRPSFRPVHDYAHGEVLARPHFARWLVDNGLAGGVADAFAKYLLPESPRETRCYEDRWHPSQEDAFGVVHRAGGLCIMAHPKFWRREWKFGGCDFAVAERGLAELLEKGLDGVEAIYQANAPGENVAFVEIASRLRCLKTAGSDFHGSNKPSISLGMEVSESFIGPVMEALKK